MQKKLEMLNKQQLQEIIQYMNEILTGDQKKQLKKLVELYLEKKEASETKGRHKRMSQEMVEEKISEIRLWMEEIDDGELYLNAVGYEEYSEFYWDREWTVEYYDEQGVGDAVSAMIRFAKDCVDDGYYEGANEIYEWLWSMEVMDGSEGEEEPADLEMLAEHEIIFMDLKQIALLTLYAGYQFYEKEKRAEELYLYFSHGVFWDLHMEDMLHVGREELSDVDAFWKDWIALLKTKQGDREARLLKEAILYTEGAAGLKKAAGEIGKTHPFLYLDALTEYEKNHDYESVESLGVEAMDQLEKSLTVRSTIALRTAYAASVLSQEDVVMECCWEAFCSDSTVRNFLRLFGTEKLAKKYGMRGREILADQEKADGEKGANSAWWGRTQELRKNIIAEDKYRELCFFCGDFEKAKNASKNPDGFLGWSGSFIRIGLRLFLLYLYENPYPSEAAMQMAGYVGFCDEKEEPYLLDFEKDILEESRKKMVSQFWNYFQRWKAYFPMEEKEKERYLAWAEKMARGRADAIVSGQHRRQYGESAAFLALVGEIREQRGENGAKQNIHLEYKKKFPRHSSFQAEIRRYFGY